MPPPYFHSLQEKEKYDTIIDRAFNNDKLFQNTLNQVRSLSRASQPSSLPARGRSLCQPACAPVAMRRRRP
jgi:hypothetical protein